jgi:hypothetical protein
MQLNYLPSIRQYGLFAQLDTINLNIEEYYDRRTERNRTLIASANGPLLLVIPTGKIAPADRFYKAIPIAYEEPWQKKHWKSLESSYRRSPYFEFYEHHFSSFYANKQFEYLWEFNFALFETINKLLKLSPQINFDPIAEKFTYPSKIKPYTQVFESKNGFIEKLSIFDLLANKGPDSTHYLKSQI